MDVQYPLIPAGWRALWKQYGPGTSLEQGKSDARPTRAQKPTVLRRRWLQPRLKKRRDTCPHVGGFEVASAVAHELPCVTGVLVGVDFFQFRVDAVQARRWCEAVVVARQAQVRPSFTRGVFLCADTANLV